jgi:glyoxylase I family protein
LFKFSALSAKQLLQLVEHLPDQLIRSSNGPARLIHELTLKLIPAAVVRLCALRCNQVGALPTGGSNLIISAGLGATGPGLPPLTLSRPAQPLGCAVAGLSGAADVGRANARSLGVGNLHPAAAKLFSLASTGWASDSLGSVQRMRIKLENVGIAVRDLEAAIAFFTDLGLTVLGRDTVSGEWTDTAVGLDGNHANIAMLQTPDGNGRLELFEYIHPDAIETEPTRPNEIGMHRVAFSVDDIDEALAIASRHGCHPLRGVATYEDVYKLTYVRGPSGILVMLAEELKKS